MVIIGKEGCPQCKILQTSFPFVRYIEIPDVHIGLGDTICSVACKIGIEPCASCRVRQHWCNIIFPYWWNYNKVPKDIRILKQRLLRLKIKYYPIIMNDTMDSIVPIEQLYNT